MQKTTLFLILCSLSACSTTDPMGGDDGGGSGDDDGGGGGAWTAVHLVDEGDIPRADNDLVMGIYYSAPDRGYIVTQGDEQSFHSGGAVFAMQGKSASVAFSGKDGGPSIVGTVSFTGIDPTPNGFVATAYAADVVTGDSAGHFTIAANGELGGTEQIIGFRETATGTTFVRETGVVSTSPSAPGPSAVYTDIWAPGGESPTPDPLPADLCQDGPMGTGVPRTRASVYISADRSFIAYTAAASDTPQVCISTDGGMTFSPKILAGLSEDAYTTPDGVVFASATTGVTYWGSTQYPEAAYIQRTTNGGMTWSAVAFPSAVASHRLDLNYAFFAPDGKHGWIVGYDHDDSLALALVTSDGGATWAPDATGLAAAVGDHILMTGFALDATHVWVGGDRGAVFTTSK